MSELPDVMTAQQLAHLAGVSGVYVARLCRTGRIPAARLGPSWMIKREAAEAWLAGRRRKRAR